jgi:hypothetical protein
MCVGVVNNFVAIEDDIVEKLSPANGLKKIYREPVSESLSDQNAETPSLYITYEGYLVKQSTKRRQTLTTIWQIGVLCRREDYITTGGSYVQQVIALLRSKTAKSWLGDARMADVGRKETKPEFGGKCAFFPVVFEIDVVIISSE